MGGGHLDIASPRVQFDHPWLELIALSQYRLRRTIDGPAEMAVALPLGGRYVGSRQTNPDPQQSCLFINSGMDTLSL